MKELDQLIEKLDGLFSDPDNFDEEGYAYDTEFDGIDPYSTLVYDNVCVPMGKISYMREHGYEVTCLERDSFGWLSAGISKKINGKLYMLIFG